MPSTPWQLYGQALSDYQAGDKSAKLTIISDIEETLETQVSVFFREPDDFPPLEKTAMGLCKGRVLDIGAGAGCHALALQELGHTVQAIDIVPEAVSVMIARGVKNAVRSDIFDFHASPFDTILMMMNGIGIVKDLKGLTKFFKHASSLIKNDGKLVLDSIDLRHICNDAEIAAREAESDRDYFGQVRYRFGYKGKVGDEFWWLYVDTDTLTGVAGKNGWFCESIYTDDGGSYLAVLKPNE